MLRHEGVGPQVPARNRARFVWPVAVVSMAALSVMLPWLLRPYAADGLDFLHHILRLIEFNQQVNLGNAFPLRFPDYSHGYGLATLSFYPPLAYLLMETLHLLGANYLLAYQMTFLIAVLGAALASYYLGVRLFNQTAAMAVSIAYIYNPYFLMEVWKRSSVTVTLSLAVIPLLFAAIHRVTQEAGWRGYAEASLAVALLILAHPLTAVYFAPFLAAWASLSLILWARGRRWRALAILIASALTGAFLTTFYWLPLQLETETRQSIDLPAALGFFIRALKPVERVIRVGLTLDFRSPESVPDFSIAVPVLVAISLIYVALTLGRRSRTQKAQIVFFAVSAAIAFLAMTTWARPLYERLTPVAYLQFPFRWHGPLTLFTALIIGAGLGVDARGRFDRGLRLAVGGIFAFLVITSLLNAPDTPAQMPTVGIAKLTARDFEAPDLLQNSEHTEDDYTDTSGCWIWGERLVPSTSLLSDCTRYLDIMLRDAPVRSGLPPVNAQVIPVVVGPDVLAAKVNSAEPWQLSLHAYWIPGWTATVDGQPAPARPIDAIGLAGVAVPAGEHEVRLAFGATPLRRVAVWVSLLALVAWLVIAWRRHWRVAAAVTVGLLLIGGLIGGRALTAPRPPTLTPMDVNLGGKIGLEGYAFVRQGEALDVRLLWLARQPVEESYKVFIHVNDDQGRLLAQTDSRPLNYASNTNRWIPGQVVSEGVKVPLPPDTPPGRYQVRVGLYNEADGQRLPVLDSAGVQVDDQVLLGYFEVH